MDEIVDTIKDLNLYFDYKDKGSGEQAKRNKEKLLSLLEAVAKEQTKHLVENGFIDQSYYDKHDLGNNYLVTDTLKQLNEE